MKIQYILKKNGKRKFITTLADANPEINYIGMKSLQRFDWALEKQEEKSLRTCILYGWMRKN
jgi:tRNA G46 methylase TrmB